MKRFCARRLAILALFGLASAATSARADDPNIVVVSPTDNATVNVGSGSAKLKVVFELNNGFRPVATHVKLNGASAISTLDFTYSSTTGEYTAEFTVAAGNYPNTTVEIIAEKPGNSGGAPREEDSKEMTGITVNKAP